MALPETLKKNWDAVKASPPLQTLDRGTWYRLGEGKALAAVQESLRLNAGGKDIKLATIEALAKDLGMDSPLLRNDTLYGPSAHFPKVYHDPASDTFFMFCPEGYPFTGADLTHFIPDGGQALSETEARTLLAPYTLPKAEAPALIERTPLHF